MKNKREIEKSINHLTSMLNTLRPRIENNEEYNKAYNRLLIQRAQLRKKLSGNYADNIINLFKSNLKYLSKLYV